MPYRPLNHNETVIVERTLYDVRGLGEGAATGLLMAFTAFAKREDRPVFDVFQDAEKDRLKSEPIDKQKFTAADGTSQLFEVLEKELHSTNDEGRPANMHDWFYGEEGALDAQHKRLRVLFHNSRRYREQVLFLEIQRGTIDIADLDDLALIGSKLAEFQRKYPGTRQGVISHYEIFFGDPSGFSYSTAMERNSFHSDPEVRRRFLEFYHLPLNWTIDDIKTYLKDRAIDSCGLSDLQS